MAAIYTPAAGLDYSAVSGVVVTFHSDEDEKVVQVNITDDFLRERSETFTGRLMISPLSAAIAKVTVAQATIEIVYNDCK